MPVARSPWLELLCDSDSFGLGVRGARFSSAPMLGRFHGGHCGGARTGLDISCGCFSQDPRLRRHRMVETGGKRPLASSSILLSFSGTPTHTWSSTFAEPDPLPEARHENSAHNRRRLPRFPAHSQAALPQQPSITFKPDLGQDHGLRHRSAPVRCCWSMFSMRISRSSSPRGMGGRESRRGEDMVRTTAASGYGNGDASAPHEFHRLPPDRDRSIRSCRRLITGLTSADSLSFDYAYGAFRNAEVAPTTVGRSTLSTDGRGNISR